MEFSLYIHIPYCDSKCPYCDFNSHVVPRWPEQRYVDALCRELDHCSQSDLWRDGIVRTIFLGGGTPSLFSPKSIARILGHVRATWDIRADAEVTIESNPGTVDGAKLQGFLAAGVNRISFGVQSFDDGLLGLLGRIHDGRTAADAVSSALRVGFDDVNLDLMFAVPGQTVEQWESDLRQAVDLGTTHISAYNLTFEEGTVFYAQRRKGKLRSAEEDTEIAMYEVTENFLGARGFERYEISNYARPGRMCRHNLTYWRAQTYLGVGAGAHSFGQSAALRWHNELGPEKYMADVESRGHARVREEQIEPPQARGEFVFLGLRCCEGIATDEFRRRFGVDLDEVYPQGAAMRDQGLLECTEDYWRLTKRGRMVSDAIFATFV